MLQSARQDYDGNSYESLNKVFSLKYLIYNLCFHGKD